MFLIIATFTLTTGLYGFMLWLACRRVARHLQGNPEAVKALTENLMLPILGRHGEQKPVVQKTKATLV